MHSFTRGVTARAQLFVYKLYTFFVGCNALVLPLQHFNFISKFNIKPNCIDYHETNA